MKRNLMYCILAWALLSIIISISPASAQASGATSVTDISVPSLTVVVKGKTATIQASITPSDATASIAWNSSNASVMTVNSKGVITGVKVGAAYATASAGGKSAKCLVRVVEKTGFYTVDGKTYYCSPATGL